MGPCVVKGPDGVNVFGARRSRLGLWFCGGVCGTLSTGGAIISLGGDGGAISSLGGDGRRAVHIRINRPACAGELPTGAFPACPSGCSVSPSVSSV